MSEPTSIWKKEIRLGGSREPAPPENGEAPAGDTEPAEQTSIWKKEIRLGGSREPAAPREPGEPEPEQTSIWKKEIRLGGSREPAAPREPGEPEPEQTSIWKKEIRLGGSRDGDAGEQTSIWKKEIRIGRRPRLDAAVEEAMNAGSGTSDAEFVGKQSLWKKEFHIGSAPGDHPSFWKKDIRLIAPRKVDARAALPLASSADETDSPPAAPEAEWALPKQEDNWFDPEPTPGTQPAATPAPAVSFDEIDARLAAAKAALAASEPPLPVPAPEPAESMLEHLSVTPARPEPVLEPEPPSYAEARKGVSLDEIDARLEAAKAVLAAVEAKPTVAPAVTVEPPQAQEPAPADPVAPAAPVADVVAPSAAPVVTPPPVSTLAEIEARIEASKAAAAALDVQPAPEPALLPEPEPELVSLPQLPKPSPLADPQADLKRVFEDRADAELDEIDARLAAAKAAFLSALSPSAPKPVPTQVEAPAPAAFAPAPVAAPVVVIEPVPAETAATETAPTETAPAPAAEPAAVPFWKKEIGGSRSSKPKAERASKRAKAERAPKAASQPFWKKEISLGRSTKAKVEPVVVAESAPVAERAPKATSQPFWKKELSLGRSTKPKAAPAPKAERAPKAASQPFWKKEITLGRSAKPARPVPVAEPVAYAAPAVEPVVQAAEPPVAPLVQAAPPVEPTPVAETPVAAAVEPVPVVERAPRQAATQPFWKKELSLGRSSKPKAASAPKAGSQPFWKKELSLGRSSKPKAAAAPKAERAPKAASQPFWKKELSLGRSSKPKAAAAPKAASQPFWKKELSLGRSSAPKAARAPRVKGSSGEGLELAGGVVDLVGLRIGSSQLAAALIHNNGSAELLQLATTPLEPGIVADGEVRDSSALGRALKRFFAQNRLPRSGVRLGVATNRIGVRVLDMPAMDDPKLFENAIRFRAQEVLPFPLADAVIDHVLLNETIDQAGAKDQRVLLVFAHRELVDGYVDACRRAGLKLAGVDFEAFALLRALSGTTGEAPEQTAALVAVAIGRERTIFAVSDGSTCDFARVLEWGGASVDAALATALKITPEDAERLKRSLSLDGDGAIGALSATESEVARAAVREELQVLARELVSSLQFYQSRSESLDIGEVLITGGGAQLGGIEAELGRQLGVPIRRGDALGRVSVGESVVTPDDAGSLAIAVGLGIEA